MIPLRSIKAPNIVKVLIKFFTFVGLPKVVQSDQGSNFMSGLFQHVLPYIGKVWSIDSFQAFGERKFGELIDQLIGY